MGLEDIQKQITDGDEALHKGILASLKTTDTGKAYASTIANTYFEENIKPHDKKLYDSIDAVLTASGVVKPEGMKTSEFVALVAKNNKDLATKLAAANTNPEEGKKMLQDAIDKHKKEIDEITGNYKKNMSEKDLLISSLNKKQIVSLKSSEIEKALADLSFNKGLDAAIIKKMISATKSELIKNSKSDEGKVVWCKEDGTPIKGENGMLNATLDEVLNQELKSILATKTAGGGADPTPPTSGKFTGTEVIVPMEGINTQEQFVEKYNKIAQASGISQSDKNFYPLYEDAKKRYNVESLPEL